jgi:glycine oxidase
VAAAPPTSASPDVVIVGAGLAGLPVAWELLRRGATVRMLDRGRPGEGTSRVAAGMLAPVTEVEPDDPVHLTLGQLARERWPGYVDALRTATGREIAIRTHGTLAVARDRDEAEALDRFRGICDRFGLATERLMPSAARKREPALAPTLRLALEIPDDAAVDPRTVTAALADAVVAAGGTIESGCEVRRLVLEDGRAVAVERADGTTVRAGAVVIAGGAESARLVGIPDHARVPVRPVKGQLLMLRDPAGPGMVERVLRFGPGYLVPRDDGRYVLGATTEERGFDRTVTAWAVHDLLRDGSELVPGVLDLELVETLVGWRPTSPDGLPAVGPARDVDGLWWATGQHRNGVLFASITGALLADALTGDRTLPARYGTIDPVTVVDPRRFASVTVDPDDPAARTTGDTDGARAPHEVDHAR